MPGTAPPPPQPPPQPKSALRASFSAIMPTSSSSSKRGDCGASSAGQNPTIDIPIGPGSGSAGAGGAEQGGGGLRQLSQTHGEDHTVTNLYWPSARRYPPDCPRLNVRWFYAVDVAKVVPSFWGNSSTKSKPKGPPKKFVPFSPRDSDAVENRFQQLVEEQDLRRLRSTPTPLRDSLTPSSSAAATAAHSPSSAEEKRDLHDDGDDDDRCKVPVNEDFLFDVNIPKRELSPAYWMGPTYDVRRGSWFFQDGSSLKSCDENLSIQLEEGYLKLKPWRQRPEMGTPEHSSSSRKASASDPPAPRESTNTTRHHGNNHHRSEAAAESTYPTYRLFGHYMNNVVTYEDATTAYLATDDFMSRMSSTVYQTFGSRFSGTKVIRGYSEAKPKAKEAAPHEDAKSSEVAAHTTADTPSKPETESENENVNVNESADKTEHDKTTTPGEFASDPKTLKAGSTNMLEQSFSLMNPPANTAEAQEAANQHHQWEMEDIRERKGDEQGREIDHLILVSHGIGQRLGIRLESINFVHDVNTLRKTMKNVYSVSPDLQALNSDLDSDAKNCRVQVLPVCWRHKLDFPMQGLKQYRKEADIADGAESQPETRYPSLNDIMLEGVPQVRNLLTDLSLDVLFYQNSIYREHIAKIVVNECNRIIAIFKKRNPGFKGTVSFCGHSLGSAVMFDILCHQPPLYPKKPAAAESASYLGRDARVRSEPHPLQLNFQCENHFGLGSPVALFQMLQGRTIAGASSQEAQEEQQQQQRDTHDHHQMPIGLTDHDSSISVPQCKEVYNIFHPSDPVSFRLEPMISPDMANLKPQPLPFIKRSIWNAPGQSLTSFSARVGQSVGSLWTNITSGVASSLLNRSLGINEPNVQQQNSSVSPGSNAAAKPTAQHQHGEAPAAGGGGGATTAASSRTVSDAGAAPFHAGAGGSVSRLDSDEADASSPSSPSSPSPAPAPINQDIETLYDGFQKRRMQTMLSKSTSDFESPQKFLEAEAQARRLRSEDAKVRALNSNGRVDYAIQEGAFDISLIASLASHISYWSDEDVCHFIMSQLLSQARRKIRSQRKSTSASMSAAAAAGGSSPLS